VNSKVSNTDNVKVIDSDMYDPSLLTKLQQVGKEIMMQDQMFGMYDDNYQTMAKYATNEDNAMDLGTKSEGNNEAMDTNSDDNTEDNNNNNFVQPNNDIWSNFQSYVVNAQQFLPLWEKDRSAMCLLYQLHKTKAAMDMYESIMKSHFIETEQMKEGMSLSHVDAYISQKALFKKLHVHYNMMEGWGKVTEFLMSSTKTCVKFVHNAFAAVAQCMITDP
jgi:hypothetical protein